VPGNQHIRSGKKFAHWRTVQYRMQHDTQSIEQKVSLESIYGQNWTKWLHITAHLWTSVFRRPKRKNKQLKTDIPVLGSEAPSLHTTHSNFKQSNWLHKSESIPRNSQHTVPLVVNKWTGKFSAFSTFTFSKKCYLTIFWLSAPQSSGRTFSISIHRV
jgi:hypothetical protein